MSLFVHEVCALAGINLVKLGVSSNSNYTHTISHNLKSCLKTLIKLKLEMTFSSFGNM